MKPENHPVVKAYRASDPANQAKIQTVEQDGVRQIALEEGADDGSLVDADRPALAEYVEDLTASAGSLGLSLNDSDPEPCAHIWKVPCLFY